MSNKGLIQRLVLAAVLAVGFLSAWGVVGIWAIEVGRCFVLGHGEHESVVFQKDGTPLVRHSDGRGNHRYRDPEGNAVTPFVDDPNARLNGTRLPASLPVQLGTGDVSWEDRIRSFDDERTPPVRWHFVSDGQPEGEAYFVGYDSQSKGCVGYLGAAGFHAEMPSAEDRIPFGGFLAGLPSRVFCPEHNYSVRRGSSGALEAKLKDTAEGALSPWMVYVLGRDQKLYEADLRKRTVRVVLDEARLRSAALVRDSRTPNRASFHQLAARTDDAVIVLDDRGRQLRRYPIPKTLRDRTIHFAETSTGAALMYWESEDNLLSAEIEYRICWVEPDDHIRESGLTLPNHHSMRSMQMLSAAAVPSPLALDVFLTLLRSSSQARRENSRAESLPEAIGLALIDFWPALAIAQLLAAALATLCYHRQMRYGTTRHECVIWPLFVLLLGLPGWIGYRFGRKWPVLESCPDCGVAVPRDRESCVRCTNDFPQPSLKGTEVFA